MMGEPSQAVDQATACPDDGNAQLESSRLEATTNMTCNPSRLRRPLLPQRSRVQRLRALSPPRTLRKA
jgi:hypothetical protein